MYSMSGIPLWFLHGDSYGYQDNIGPSLKANVIKIV